MINIVNISFNKNLLLEIDKVAQAEARTRSELIREAARMYLERKKQWKNIFSFGAKHAKEKDLKESDVHQAIKAYRKAK